MNHDFLNLLQEKTPGFSKGQRRIAQYIMEAYDKAAFMTASRLGKNVGVSESTVVRFAVDLGFDGLIVESHCNPDEAWSDAKQQVTPDILDYILSLLVVRDEHTTTEGLRQLRSQIDELDNQLMDLLAKRMRVCREIGTYKKEHNMTVLQATRYNEILEKRGAQASLCGMNPEFAAQVFEHIHEESVRQQLEIVNQ